MSRRDPIGEFLNLVEADEAPPEGGIGYRAAQGFEATDSIGTFPLRNGGLLQLETLLYTQDLCIIIVGCDYLAKP